MRLLSGYGRLLSIMLFSLFASVAQANGVNDLDSFYNKVDSLSAHFQQIQQDEDGNTLQQASGTFLLDRPDRFRWQYEKPYKQIIVSDGKAFKFYDVDLAQVTIRDINATLRATPAVLLTGGASLEDAFDVSDGGTHDGMSWVRLQPRASDTDFREIKLGLKHQVPAMMELDDSLGQTTRIRFTDVTVNPKMAASRFTLDIPDDVEVVDGRKKSANIGGR